MNVLLQAVRADLQLCAELLCAYRTSRDYAREETGSVLAMPFGPWLRRRCAAMTAREQDDRPDLMALSLPPAKKVCAFSSMASYGSHYRVDMEEAGARHVTYDSGVAELKCTAVDPSSSYNAVQVEVARVGVLKNILVMNYGNLNIVLMVVSWVATHTDEHPTLCRDEHGFWLANMAARPRDTTHPYLLPALASQVKCGRFPTSFCCGVMIGSPYTACTLNLARIILQVFFVEDKAMPGWSVVLKKEARGRRIGSTEEEHGLGQEASRDDLLVLSNSQSQGRGAVDGVVRDESGMGPSKRRRPNIHRDI